MLGFMSLPSVVARAVAEVADGFTGLAAVDGPGGREYELAQGLANRALALRAGPCALGVHAAVLTGDFRPCVLRARWEPSRAAKTPFGTWSARRRPRDAPRTTKARPLHRGRAGWGRLRESNP